MTFTKFVGCVKGFPPHSVSFSLLSAFDLVNIHLFHDASNLVAWEKSPSVYSGTRQKALGFVLDRWGTRSRLFMCVCVSIFWKLAVKRPSTLNKCMQTLRICYQAIGRLMNYVPLLCLKDHIFPLTPSVSYPMRGRSGSNGQPSWSALGTQVLLRHHLLWFTAIMKFKKDLSCCLHWGF